MSKSRAVGATKKAGRRKGRARVEPFWNVWAQMTDAERDRYVEQYEQEIHPSECEPPTPEEARRHERAMAKVRRGPGRPRIGKGAKQVLVSIERGLLEQVDRYAKAHKLSRSELIARALATVIARAG